MTQVINWTHRCRMMQLLADKLLCVGLMMEMRKELINAANPVTEPRMSMFHRERMRELINVHKKLEYYWEQFANE